MIPLDDASFERIATLALSEAGLNLQPSKRSFVASRLQRRLRATSSPSFGDYLHRLDGSDATAAGERDRFVSALTTNVSGIFREIHHFEILATFLRRVGAARPVRIWSAGCATGEETLSIAATCRAVLGTGWVAHCRILATDVDADALARAIAPTEGDAMLEALRDGLRQAVGRAEIGRPPCLSELLEGITFMRHNLLKPLPTTRVFDVVFCRNVTIYFAPAVQRSVQSFLLDRLAADSLLCLGHSERLQVAAPGMSLIGPTAYATGRMGRTAR